MEPTEVFEFLSKPDSTISRIFCNFFNTYFFPWNVNGKPDAHVMRNKPLIISGTVFIPWCNWDFFLIQWDCMYSVEDNCYSCKHCLCKKQPWHFRGANYWLLCGVSDEKPFKCSQCESSFRKNSGLKQHVTRQHSQNTPQKSTQAQTNQSYKKSSSANDRPYACQVRPTCPPVSKYICAVAILLFSNKSLGILSGNSRSPIYHTVEQSKRKTGRWSNVESMSPHWHTSSSFIFTSLPVIRHLVLLDNTTLGHYPGLNGLHWFGSQYTNSCLPQVYQLSSNDSHSM